MGKPYNHSYHFKGGGSSCGTMVCAGCREPIHKETQDWRSYQTSCPKEDWRYVTHHRKCCADDPEWQKIENRNANDKADCAAFNRDFEAFKAKWSHRPYWINELVGEAAA